MSVLDLNSFKLLLSEGKISVQMPGFAWWSVKIMIMKRQLFLEKPYNFGQGCLWAMATEHFKPFDYENVMLFLLLPFRNFLFYIFGFVDGAFTQKIEILYQTAHVAWWPVLMLLLHYLRN